MALGQQTFEQYKKNSAMAMCADIRAFALYLSSIGFFVLCDNGQVYEQ